MKYDIIPIDRLLPLELVFPTHLKNLAEMIDKDGFLLKAIIADKKTGTILDGSHRYVYFLRKGYKEIPTQWVNYDSEDIRVGTHLRHRFLIDGDPGINKKECIERALSGNLFPPRTTRHFFTFRKLDISLPLSKLKKGTPVDISHLIADVDVSDEIKHNKKYINEINEEIEVIIQYLEEVSRTKGYLTKQVEHMDKTRQVAFFPGKFHPPHLGHIQTINKILSKYKKVIIGVTGNVPADGVLVDSEQIYILLKDFFEDIDNIEVAFIKGTLVRRNHARGLPQFDVLLSGNKDVINWAHRYGINAKYIDRSEGFLCSGTEVRAALGVKNVK